MLVCLMCSAHDGDKFHFLSSKFKRKFQTANCENKLITRLKPGGRKVNCNINCYV